MVELHQREKIYLKRTCPFCLKLYIFLTEANLSGEFDIRVFDDGDETHKLLRERLTSAGQEASFPAAEGRDGTLSTGSDDLIGRYAATVGLDASSLPLLTFYTSGVFPRHLHMHRELRELKPAA